MDSLSRSENYHKIECSPDERIYIARQNMRYGGSALSFLQVDENQQTRDCVSSSKYKARCHVKGKINASRILEQTHVELRISQGSNQICTEWSGAFHYNKDLACSEGLDDILIDLDVRKTDALTILWIEIKGDYFQIDCREEHFSGMPLHPNSGNTDQKMEEESIVGGRLKQFCMCWSVTRCK
ncbi:uncharacterized protein LOC133182823 [Saccostrea echinata]|uniref:uncharacterized protein LOC133182823 n=1 Tax=Saccostrea echinata TaxID=191078 RepID=UPI002A83D9AF|nr:uncharacterized protein LOC133182823 [Saccostrea echinata]